MAAHKRSRRTRRSVHERAKQPAPPARQPGPKLSIAEWVERARRKSHLVECDALAAKHKQFLSNIKVQAFDCGYIKRLVRILKADPTLRDDLRFRIHPSIFELLVEKTYLTVDDRAIIEGDNKTLHSSNSIDYHVKTEDAANKHGYQARTEDVDGNKLESTKIYDEVIEGDKELSV